MKKPLKLTFVIIIVLVIAAAGAVAGYYYNESRKSGFVKGAEKVEQWGKNVVKETKNVFK